MPVNDDLNVAGVKSREQIIGLGAYWKEVRYDRPDGTLAYKGCHFIQDVDEDDPNWSVWKYVYSDGLLVREIGPVTGSWQDREDLDWGAASASIPSLSIDYTKNPEYNFYGIMEQVLEELQKINTYLSILTDEEI